MRLVLMAATILAGTAAPALAQRAETVEQRLERVEQQLRAVQRRVFPGGRAQFVEPEIGSEPAAPTTTTTPTGDALMNLTARVDAREAQLRSLTGPVEEQGFRTRQLEQQIGQLRTDITARLDRLEAASRPAPAAEPPTQETTRPAPREAETAEPAAERPAAQPSSAEEAYNEGYRLWNARRYGEAQQALEAAATRYPSTRWTSWMRNLQGRAYLDDNKPATAARIFLANYQDNPQGERAADSLFYLGQALTRLNRRPEACRVYAELEQVYPNMRSTLRDGLPRARTEARCSGTAASR